MAACVKKRMIERLQVLFDKPVGATSEIAQTIRAGLVQ
jgi:hypothetical protein